MNFNPFAKHVDKKNILFRGRHLSMFERVVGNPESMGILDYVFILPFLIKLGLHLSQKRASTIIFSAASVPLAMAKFFTFIALSPLVITAWAVKKAIKRIKEYFHISPFAAALNQIGAKRIRDRNDVEIKPVPLEQIKRFNDGKLKKYIIKCNYYGELVIARADNEHAFAVLAKDRKDILALQRLIALTDGNTLDIKVKYNCKLMIQDSARQKIAQLDANYPKQMVALVDKLLVKSSKPENEHTVSFTHIDSAVRRNIAKYVLWNDIDPTAPPSRFFASCTKDEREAAVLEYISAAKIR